MRLKQTLAHPTRGKQVFMWSIDGLPMTDAKGKFVRIGSFGANFWLHVAQGKTEKLTLSYAKAHLKRITRMQSSFEYVQ
jgi:hypothetical protein